MGPQSVYAEGRALEFRTDLSWTRLVFGGEEKIAGTSPLRVPGPLAGDFWLSAGGPGVETQRGRVRIRLDENGSRISHYGQPPLQESLMRSALFPGYPQLRSGHYGRSFYFAALGVTAGVLAILAQDEVSDAEDRLDAAERAASQAVTASERTRLLLDAQDRLEDYDYEIDRRNLYLMSLAAVWGVSAVDAVIFAPGFNVAFADENSLTLGMRRKTRFDAMLRSLVLPGLGQAYNGQGRKAALVAMGAAGAIGWLIHEQDRYNDAVRDYEKVNARLGAAWEIEELEILRERGNRLFEEVDDRYRNRNIALGIVGGYWGLAILDTALSFGEPWGRKRVSPGGSSLGWSVDPARGRVGARIRF
jgi:hypothetical protein